MGKLSMWGDKVVKHFWYCCQACKGDLETLKVNSLRTVAYVHCIQVYMHNVQRTCSLAGRALSVYIQIPSNHCSALDVPFALFLSCVHVCTCAHVHRANAVSTHIWSPVMVD